MSNNPAYQPINPNSGALPAGVIVETEQQPSGAQRQVVAVANATGGDPFQTEIIDADGHIVNVQAVTAQLDGNEYGAVSIALIHGLDNQGHWHDVKVTHSGELTTSTTLAGVDDGVIVPITRADDLYNDAFQRLRVSNTDQRFDSEFQYDKSPLVFDDISTGGGSTTYNAASRDVTIATGSTSAAVAAGLRQHWANIYTSGNSQFIIETGTLNGAGLAGGRAEVFLRSSVTGSVTEQALVISDATIDWSKSQIFIMDFQSLRVGRIRWGLDRAGIATPLAEITNDNIRATGYWQIANQPVYWRQYNTANYTYTEVGYGDEANAIGFRYRVAVNATQTMRAICATVKSEGGGDLHNIAGIRGAISNGITKRTVSTTFVPLLSLQVKSTLNGYPVKSVIFPKTFEISNDNPIYFEWRINATLTGAAWTSNGADSLANFDVTATAVTGGRVIYEGYAGAAGAGARNIADGALTSKIPLGVSALGVGDILTLCCIRDGTTNASVGAALVYEDIR